ncbi:YjfI family protein [Thalassotalea sp. PLHSN55]|uniref:YjfI family protein n=1 Tax=Thalassotalea sp. PLHSN55 TaxID=3435888 RepID=UPI003F8509EC
MNIHKIANHLNTLADNSETGMVFDCQPISGEVDVLQISVVDREELPIFVSVTDDQILCITYLWGQEEVKPESIPSMHESMLEMNIPMPLSSFAKIGDKYVIFGALSINSTFDDIEHELAVLSNNAIEIIDDMSDFLI